MNVMLREPAAWQTVYSGEEPISGFSDVRTERVAIERTEISPPSTARPSWLVPTINRMLELLAIKRTGAAAGQVPRDTLCFALMTLAQILPPTAPPPTISMRHGSGVYLSWDTNWPRLSLEISKPNNVLFVQADKTLHASVDFRPIAELCWAAFHEDHENRTPTSDHEAKDANNASLGWKIEAFRKSNEVDREFETQAQSAISDAAEFAHREFPQSSPRIELTNEGVLTLQWQSANKGIMLVFTGDGTATYAIKEPGGWYSLGAKEIDLSAALPGDARAAIQEIEGA